MQNLKVYGTSRYTNYTSAFSTRTYYPKEIKNMATINKMSMYVVDIKRRNTPATCVVLIF
jgi:hypothetical protein